MKRTILILGVLIFGLSLVSIASATIIVDTIDYTYNANPPFFLPPLTSPTNSTYYRIYNQDWGWTHNSIAGPIINASLKIYNYDVDLPSALPAPEFDNIYAYDSGSSSYLLLGNLTGIDNDYSDTTFPVPAALLDDIPLGLQVFMNIDEVFNGSGSQVWAVTLVKSELTVETAAVPEPATMLLLGSGLIGLAGFARRRFKK